MTPEQVKWIAENAARVAAQEAINATLTALGVDVKDMAKEQQVWAFARTMQQGTRRGVRALSTGILTTLATLIAGWVWYFFFKQSPPH